MRINQFDENIFSLQPINTIYEYVLRSYIQSIRILINKYWVNTDSRITEQK